MTPLAETPVLRRPWLPVLGLVFVAVAASISGLSNQFSQDDWPMIWKNPPVHDLLHSWRFFAQSYWPKPFTPDLYRPFALISYSLEWTLGHGAPMLFRIVSYALYAIVSVAMFRVARLALPFAPAFAAAALFAAHPVHVESVAIGVNQGELWVALICCIAVLHYVRVRRAGGPIPVRTELFLAGIYLVGCLFKENALMLPGFLLAAELLLVPGREAVGARITRGRRLLLVLMLVAVGFYGARTLVLRGDLLGTFVAEALSYTTAAQRGLTMLAVVPQWFRLLLWPAHLQSDYSPAEIVAHTAWGAEQTVGALLVAGIAIAIVLAWRRAPAISFGLLWAAVAIFPVHNVLVPTGIVLAERTLFLPSIGAMIALGGLGALLLERADDPERLGLVLAGVAGALVILGVLRSTTRHPVWSDQFGLWYETGNRDAPRSYRAHAALADMYFGAKLERRAEQESRLAIEYSPSFVVGPMRDYSNRLRYRGHCYPAVPLYRRVLVVHSNDINTRASLIACLLDIGLYKEAMLNARLGISFDYQRPTFQRALRLADSALKAGAPAGTVKLIVAPSDSSAGNLHIGTAP